MTILVTGGCGYIGSHFVHAANDAGRATVVLDDLSNGCIDAIPAYVPFIRGDAGHAETLDTVFSSHTIDTVIHFAGSVRVEESLREPLSYYENNVAKTRNLIAACVRAGAKLVFSSSAAVYGSPHSTPVDEAAPTVPISPYGRTKLAAEWMIADACEAHGLKAVALRYFNVAGADPYMRTGQRGRIPTNLIKIAAEAAVGIRDGVAVYGSDYPTPDGTCLRDYVHVADLADAHLDALRWLEAGGHRDVFNVGHGRGYSVLEILRAARQISGHDFEVRLADRRPGDPGALVAAVGRIHQTLKWRPRFDDIEIIVGHSIEWERRLSRQSIPRDGHHFGRRPALPLVLSTI